MPAIYWQDDFLSTLLITTYTEKEEKIYVA